MTCKGTIFKVEALGLCCREISYCSFGLRCKHTHVKRPSCIQMQNDICKFRRWFGCRLFRAGVSGVTFMWILRSTPPPPKKKKKQIVIINHSFGWNTVAAATVFALRHGRAMRVAARERHKSHHLTLNPEPSTNDR